MVKGKGQKAKKAAAARRATTKFVESLQDRGAVEAPPAHHREPLKLDAFKRTKFFTKDKDKMKKHEAVRRGWTSARMSPTIWRRAVS